MSVTTATAAAAQPSATGIEAIMASPIPMMVVIFVLFYFLILRPQQKRMKEQQAMINAIGKGDEVATTGGVIGRVAKAGEQYLTLEIADGVEIVVQRAAVSTKLEKGTLKAQR
ncbi:MAG: preprotein translocase subunit YajC [Burkholderiales bacterium]|nr:preprotein translocase subunit YajC [Burkholderiales bacterium]